MNIRDAIEKTKEAITAAQTLERSREASVAITHLETAKLWLQELDKDQAKDQADS